MYQMQYLVPRDYDKVDGTPDMDVTRMTAKLVGVDKKGADVPNSALRVQLILMSDGGTLEIRKHKQLVYINFFSFEADQAAEMLGVVQTMYTRYNLGVPQKPTIPTFIHSIPVAHQLLRDNEVRLCQKMTIAYYWAAFAQALKRRNKYN